jgi:hypothetical protein
MPSLRSEPAVQRRRPSLGLYVLRWCAIAVLAGLAVSLVLSLL